MARSKQRATDVVVGELVDDEQPTMTVDELAEREGRIERAQRNAYYEIGLELRAIRDRRGYRVGTNGDSNLQTWQEYLEKRWELSETRSRQLISAADAVDGMNPHNCADLIPARESHVRELLRIESDTDRAVVWQSILQNYGQHATASDVRAEVEKYLARKEKNWYTLDEYNEMPDEEWEELINIPSDKTFNKQDNASIEWAQWSWNPVTGCKHDCPYCYARDIADRFYAQKFEPAIYPVRLWCPHNTTVPETAKAGTAFKNVFTCSMADLFGRWVPTEWIELVIDEVRKNPQWNFLFLTKFPQRFAEIGTFPKNAWMGTTVDCQDRVANAEKAFSKLTGGTKWLSVEPMLTPLNFKKLDAFDWVVMGGASKSTQTPEWVPPFNWVADLHIAARSAGCAIYQKENLFSSKGGENYPERLREFPWQKSTETKLPKELTYLGMKS